MWWATKGHDMAEANSSNTTSDSGSRRWALGVSIGLWLFAAWQLYLFTPILSTAKVFGIEPPESTQIMAVFPAWLPLALGIPLTLFAALRSSRRLRASVALAALLFALATHWGHVALQIKTHNLAHHPTSRENLVKQRLGNQPLPTR